jgi:hypothetical protein
VKFNTSFEEQSKILAQIKVHLPETEQEIKVAFKHMIDQGIVLNLSL